MPSKTVIVIVCISAVFSIGYAQGQTDHGETADPEAKLKPRNFNPHPFEAVDVAESRSISVTPGKDVNLVDDNVLQELSVASSHLFRRQSPAVYNKGPIQFPSNNDVRPIAQQPRFYLKPTNQRSPAPTQQPASNEDNYDYDYDQRSDSSSLSKKHYAFSYVVRDHHSGDDFSHTQQQQKDGGVSGSYKVQLPDGRTQVVKYTADEGGYKADVSYIENSVSDNTPRSRVYQVAPTATRPNYYPPRPSPTQLSFERLSGGYELPKTNPNLQKYAIPSSHQPFASTPRPFALNSSPDPHSAYVVQPPPPNSNYVDLQNVELETYNTAPHHYNHQEQPLQSQKFVSTGRIVFPTSPSLYNDIHVLPSPKPYPYATTAPFTGKMSPKSTSIVSSPAPYGAHYHHTAGNSGRPSGTVASPASIYYLASRYSNYQHQQLQHPLQGQQFYVATVPHQSHYARRSADPVSANKVVQKSGGSPLVIHPDQALYFKHK